MTKQEIMEMIREARFVNGLSNNDIAKEMGISRQRAIQLLQADNPDLENMVKLGNAVGVIVEVKMSAKVNKHFKTKLLT